jgi:hypothetical protein
VTTGAGLRGDPELLGDLLQAAAGAAVQADRISPEFRRVDGVGSRHMDSLPWDEMPQCPCVHRTGSRPVHASTEPGQRLGLEAFEAAYGEALARGSPPIGLKRQGPV